MNFFLKSRLALVRNRLIGKGITIAIVAIFSLALPVTHAFAANQALDWPVAATKEDLDAARAVLIQWSEKPTEAKIIERNGASQTAG